MILYMYFCVHDSLRQPNFAAIDKQLFQTLQILRACNRACCITMSRTSVYSTSIAPAFSRYIILRSSCVTIRALGGAAMIIESLFNQCQALQNADVQLTDAAATQLYV